MFLSNKYTIWYFSIVESAKRRHLCDSIYVEKHHILPKSMGGDNSKDNLVPLTAREHFICHWLLTKMVHDPLQKRKMCHALGRFVQSSPLQKRLISSRQYQIARQSISKARKGKKHSEESKRKMSKARRGRPSPNKGRKGWFNQSEEAKNRIGLSSRGKTWEDRFGEERAKLIAEKVSNSKIGKPSGMLGKKHKPETLEKMSKPKKGSPHVRATCPHCGSLDMTPRHIKFCSM